MRAAALDARSIEGEQSRTRWMSLSTVLISCTMTEMCVGTRVSIGITDAAWRGVHHGCPFLQRPKPMHLFATILTVILLLCGNANAAAAPDETIEATITRLDLAEADAVLRADFGAVEKLWASDMTVNNPFNEVVRSSMGRVRTGAVTYSSFVRTIESIQVHGDTVITMGNEVVVPSGKSIGAGTTISRRYTNVWMKREGQWLLTARHANVICPH
jgi:ketosteroid isomerase-like protein